MRLSVSVDPELLKNATRLTGAHSKRETIEEALRSLVQTHRRKQASRHAGTIPLTLTRQALRQLRHQSS